MQKFFVNLERLLSIKRGCIMQDPIRRIYLDNSKLVLNKICQLTDFYYGEIWLTNDRNNFLELSSNYYVRSDLEYQCDLELFHEFSQEFVMSKGEGLPGRVFSSQKSDWILDVSSESEDSFPRNKIARICGVKTGFAVPVIKQEKVLMIMAFFTCALRSYSPECLALADLVIKHSTSNT